MGIYQSYNCPRCRKTLAHLVPRGSKGVSEPIRDCPKCGALVDIRHLYTEWALMDEREKSSMRRRVVWTAAQMGGLAGALLPFIFFAWIFPELVESGSSRALVGTLVAVVLAGGSVGFLIHYKLVKRQLQRSIHSSEERMRDTAYRKKLSALGFSSVHRNDL